MTLAAPEFIRRCLIHVLPGGFHRIRHYGLFANTSPPTTSREPASCWPCRSLRYETPKPERRRHRLALLRRAHDHHRDIRTRPRTAISTHRTDSCHQNRHVMTSSFTHRAKYRSSMWLVLDRSSYHSTKFGTCASTHASISLTRSGQQVAKPTAYPFQHLQPSHSTAYSALQHPPRSSQSPIRRARGALAPFSPAVSSLGGFRTLALAWVRVARSSRDRAGHPKTFTSAAVHGSSYLHPLLLPKLTQYGEPSTAVRCRSE
jgi:hypothetical protein